LRVRWAALFRYLARPSTLLASRYRGRGYPVANVLAAEKRLRALAALVDGCSIRAVERMIGVHRDTIARLGLTLGCGCANLHNALARGLSCADVELDEQWGYVRKKQKHLEAHDDQDTMGDAWTWTAIDRTSRLAISFYVGKRDERSAHVLINDLRTRLVVMPQFTSDGLAAYVPAIARAFGAEADLGQTVKGYTDSRPGQPREAFLTKRAALGTPDLRSATTAHNERVNLTMRHVNGRMRRKCLSFSKRLANHCAAVALSYTHYNFCRVVRTLKATPAVCAGITNHTWTLAEFMDAVLSAAPCPLPDATPLRPRERPARAPAVAAHPPQKASPRGQLDLFAWRPTTSGTCGPR